MSDTLTRVTNLVAKQLDIDVKNVQPESRFQEDLGADSLDQVEMVMAFEEEFGIEIPDNVAEKIVKVSDAVKFIDEQKKAA
ncbi:MAG: acyl carrier protein [Rickettsiales bacterium]